MTTLTASPSFHVSASYTTRPLAYPPTLAPAPATSTTTPTTPSSTEDHLLTSGIGVVGAGVLGHLNSQAIGTALASAPATAGARFSTGFSAVAAGALRNIGIGTALCAGVNVIGSTILLAMGRITKGQAAGAVVANTATSLVGTTGAILIGGAATAALGAIGVAGLPLTLAGIGLGIIGSSAMTGIFRLTGAPKAIYEGISGAIDH